MVKQCVSTAPFLKAGGESMASGLNAALVAIWQASTVPHAWPSFLESERGLLVLHQLPGHYTPGKVLSHILLRFIRDYLVRHQNSLDLLLVGPQYIIS